MYHTPFQKPTIYRHCQKNIDTASCSIERIFSGCWMACKKQGLWGGAAPDNMIRTAVLTAELHRKN